MASKAIQVRRALSTIRTARASRPIVIRQTKIQKAKKHRHHKGGAGGIFSGNRVKIMGGAFALGLLQKSGIAANLPKIPLLGETGTIGLAAHFLGGSSRLAQDIATAAFAIAAFELGSTGAIVGDATTEGYVAGF
jgi:hypothetical protein